MRTKQESPLSKEEEALVMEGLLSRKIWRFYELLSKWAPIPLMLGHWYGVWDYGHYPQTNSCRYQSQRELHHLDLCTGIHLYATDHDTGKFLLQILLDIPHSVLLFFRYQRYQTILSALAHHSRAVGDAPCVYHIHFNALRLWIYQNRSIEQQNLPLGC